MCLANFNLTLNSRKFNLGLYIYKDFKNNEFYGTLIRLPDFYFFLKFADLAQIQKIKLSYPPRKILTLGNNLEVRMHGEVKQGKSFQF